MRWIAFTALGVLALVAASSSSAPQAAIASSCVGAQVHYGQAPKPRLGIRLPWIAAGRQGRKVIGHLFYYGQSLREQSGGRLMIYTGGESPGGGSKILWMVRPLSSSQVVISGRQLDGSGRFEQQFRAASASEGTVFPSSVNVPNAGCWLLTVRNGRVAGRFAVVAVDRPAAEEPVACTENEVEQLVQRFARAFNEGNFEELDRIFAQEPDFEWYVTAAPGERIELPIASDRASLVPYFRERHDLGERLTVTRFRFNGNGRSSWTYGNFEFALTRSARDLPATAYGGKGAALCYRNRSDELIVWAMAEAT
jgi:hypothetical protein